MQFRNTVSEIASVVSTNKFCSLPVTIISLKEKRGSSESFEGEGQQVLHCWGQHSGAV
jgi:hypothetical protein